MSLNKVKTKVISEPSVKCSARLAFISIGAAHRECSAKGCECGTSGLSGPPTQLVNPCHRFSTSRQ